MTQTHDQPSRLDRIEALTLELAAANLRHDRTIDSNTTTIARHDEWLTQQAQAISRHEQWQAEHEAAMQRHETTMQRIEAQQELNQQAIAQFTAGLVELRTLVSDYLQGRSQIS